MPVTVTCECSNSISLEDELAGSLVTCPACGGAVRAGNARYTPESSADPVFGRDIFLLRQKMRVINEKYDVCDEQGNPLVYVERPAHLLRNLFAVLAGMVASAGWVILFMAVEDAVGAGTAGNVAAALAIIGFIPVLVLVAVGLSRKRHVTFYAGPDKRQRLLDVLQDEKLHILKGTYTVRDADGTPLARLRKRYLFNLIRKRWDVLSPDGRVAWVAKEDSIVRSILRRLLGPLFGFLRTNFVFHRAGSNRVIGEFERKLTILDRYVLDLTADTQRAFDRRVALALGVMLDTGERR